MTDLKIIEEAFPLQGDFAQDAKYTWPSRWEAVKNDLAHVPEEKPTGPLPQLLLCMASDADGTTIRTCRDQAEAMAFYKEMWGEDLGGGVQSQIDHFSDEDNWSHGMTEYRCELYCSTFRVWRVDASDLSLPSPLDAQFKETK